MQVSSIQAAEYDGSDHAIFVLLKALLSARNSRMISEGIASDLAAQLRQRQEEINLFVQEEARILAALEKLGYEPSSEKQAA